jgi:hypothetical protein
MLVAPIGRAQRTSSAVMRPQRHHRHELHQWVPAEAAVLPITVDIRRLAPEARAILVAVGHANRCAIDAVQGQPAPPITIRTGIGPLRGRASAHCGAETRTRYVSL